MAITFYPVNHGLKASVESIQQESISSCQDIIFLTRKSLAKNAERASRPTDLFSLLFQ
jgi:hypothetical protein